MIFQDRKEAALELVAKLGRYKGKDVIVAGIPRGAMPMAKILSDALEGELTAVLVHKIPSPYSEELAMGCIGLSGKIHLLPYSDYISDSYINLKAMEQLQNLKEKCQRYGLRVPNYRGRLVIIVDDGIATGATTMCAVNEVLSYSPKKVILVTPVSSPEAAEKLRPLVDEFISLYVPMNMYSIGQFYHHFPQIEDKEVMEIIQEEYRKRSSLDLT